MNRRTFGRLVRDARIAAGISAGHVARTVGVSTPYVSDVELGKRGPFTAERLRVLAPLIGVPLQELLEAAAASREFVRIDAPCSPVGLLALATLQQRAAEAELPDAVWVQILAVLGESTCAAP